MTIDNVLVSTASELIHLLFQFINTIDVYLVNTLQHGRLHQILVVNWIEVWAVQRP